MDIRLLFALLMVLLGFLGFLIPFAILVWFVRKFVTIPISKQLDRIEALLREIRDRPPASAARNL